MKKLVFLFLICFTLSDIVKGQTLTNQQVFDFNVGDIFIYNNPSKNYPWQRTDKIIAKSFSTNNTFVNYDILSTIKTVELPINPPNLIYIITQDTLHQTFPFTSNLVFDSIAFHTYDSVPNSQNSIINYSAISLCNNNVEGYRYGQEHTFRRYEYAIGLGYVRDENVIDQNGNFYSLWDYKLEAYKIGNDICNFVGVKELKNNSNDLKYRIDCFENKLVIHNLKNSNDYYYSILSTNGSAVINGKSSQAVLEVETICLANGFYVIHIFNEQGYFNSKFIK